MQPIHIVGGGLAGTEAAWQVARRGVPAVLHEMRPARPTPAHRTGRLAELVCSNSLRSDDPIAPAGLLKHELRRCGSMVIACADQHRVPAGQAFSGAAPTSNPVTVTVGARVAVVGFSGITEAGLYQINVTVPPGTGSGDQAVTAIVNGVVTPLGPVVSVQ